MISLLVIALIAQTAPHDRHTRENRRTGGRNSTAGFAAFEAFPSNGVGTPGVPCSTTAPTGARGEVLTFTRASAATCTKTATGGLATTGIADGDLVSLSSNVARVEYDNGGVLGLLVEAGATTINIQSRPLCNAAWSDIGTPDCTADVTTGPWGTTTMARITDNDGAATEGRSQTVATTSATRFTAHCYVKAGTATSATIALLGTGDATGDCSATATGLSTTTSNIISCTSAAAYTASVTAVLVGIVIGTQSSDTGTLFVEGCDVKPSALYRTSFVDTGAVAVARALETMKVNGATFPTASLSKAVTVTTEWAQAQAPATWGLLIGEVGTTSGSDFFGVGSGVRTQNCSGSCTSITSGALSIVAGTSIRLASDQSGGLASIYKNGVLVTGPSALTAAASPWSSTTGVADNGAGVGHLDGIISRICIDPNPARCR